MNIIYLSAENFIKVLQGEVAVDQSGVEHSFLDPTGSGVILQVDPQKRHIVIEEDVVIGPNLEFDKDIEIDNVECRSLTFRGVTFHKYIYIHNGTFGNLAVEDVTSKDFVIHGGEFSTLRFSGQNNMHECVIKGINCYSIEVNGGKYQKYFEIDNVKTKNGITIYKGDFEGSYGVSLSITNNKVYGVFTIGGGIYASRIIVDVSGINELVIKAGEFIKDITLQGENSNSTCRVEGGDFRDEFNISGAKLNHLILDNQFFRLKAENTNVEKCIFLKEINYSLALYKCKFNELAFKNIITSTGRVSIDNSEVDVLLFEQFVNEGYFRVNDLTPRGQSSSQILMVKSVLGNMVLSGLSFSSYDKIVIDNCKIDSVDTLIEPFPVSNKICTDKDGFRDSLKLSEIYKQLYFSAKSRGDRANEVTYYAAYMDAYRQHLRNAKDWPTKVVLCFNKCSTDYGRNWLRGVGWIILLSVFFYFLYYISLCISLSPFTFNSKCWYSTDFSAHVANYVTFLNPVHRIDFMTDDPGWSAIIDLIARILISTLIYQTIVAFRRLGKF